MAQEPNLQDIQREWHGSLKSYLIGFLLSLLLTLFSFSAVAVRLFSRQTLPYLLVGLALAQALCQLFFFLHLGQEAKPRWESLIFCFMVLVLLIIAGGSLWIMHDLNERLMGGMSHD